MKALEELVALVEDDTGVNDVCKDESDDSCIGHYGDGKPLPMTFGHIRRARAELNKRKEPSW